MPQIDQINRWILQSGLVIGLQFVVQAILAVNGLFLLWNLSKEEYAWFTIASSLLATTILLGDGGISAGLTSIGGRIHQQRGDFARLLKYTIRRSRSLLIVSSFVVLPIYYILYRNVDTPSNITIEALVLITLAGVPSTRITLLGVANRLHAKAHTVQVAEIIGAVIRFAITAILLGTHNLNLSSCLFAIVLSIWTQYLYISHKSRIFLNAPISENSHANEVNGFIRSLFGNHAFLCLQGQISIWLIGWFGTKGELADLSALGRLVALFTITFAPINYLVIPSIARISSLKLLRRRIALTFIVIISLISLIILISHWFPAPFLFILGSKYSHLSAELSLSVAAQGFSTISGLVWSIIISRGWIRQVWISMVSATLGMALAASLFPLGTVAGMLKFSIASLIPTFIFCTAILINRLRTPTNPA